MVWHRGLCLPQGLTQALCHTHLCQAWPLLLEESEARQAHFHQEIPISCSPTSPYSCLSRVQLRVLRERCSTCGPGQAGEPRLPCGQHDWRGPDPGLVPPQGIARDNPAFHRDNILLEIISQDWQQIFSPLIPCCPKLQALGQGEEWHRGRAGAGGILPSLFHFPRAGGGRYAQNQAEGTDVSSFAFSRMAVWQIGAFYILIMYSACPGGSSVISLSASSLCCPRELRAFSRARGFGRNTKHGHNPTSFLTSEGKPLNLLPVL